MKKIFIIMPTKNYYRLCEQYTSLLIDLIGRENCNGRCGVILVPAAHIQIRMINPDVPNIWRGLCLRNEEWLVSSTGFIAQDGEYLIDLRQYFSKGFGDICTGEFSDFDDMIESVARMVKGRIK